MNFEVILVGSRNDKGIFSFVHLFLGQSKSVDEVNCAELQLAFVLNKLLLTAQKCKST